jgi:hypothetical protein
VLFGDQLSGSLPCCFTAGERALSTHLIGDWIEPRIGKDDIENEYSLSLSELELRLSRPARTYTAYDTAALAWCSILYKGNGLLLTICRRCSWEIALDIGLDKSLGSVQDWKSTREKLTVRN